MQTVDTAAWKVSRYLRFSQCVAGCCRVLQGVLVHSRVLTVAFPGAGYLRLWHCCLQTVDTASWKPLHSLGAGPRKFVEVWQSWQMWWLRPHRVPQDAWHAVSLFLSFIRPLSASALFNYWLISKGGSVCQGRSWPSCEFGVPPRILLDSEIEEDQPFAFLKIRGGPDPKME